MTVLEIRGANDIRRRLPADIRRDTRERAIADRTIEIEDRGSRAFGGNSNFQQPTRFTFRAFMAATRIVSPERNRFRSRINASA